ncbi:MAG: branched-chain amino acid transaminase [Anaerolineales bacterium]|nr:branched-chain amino acid transaminase [Anaerolineales bacterium]
MDLPRYAYFHGQIIPYSEARVGVLTHALNYGTAVFGGLRAYWNAEEEQLYLFRPLDHFKRFIGSAKLLLMEIDQTPEELTQIAVALLRQEAYRCNVYVRPLAYKSDEVIGVRLHNLAHELSIVSIPFELYVTNDTSAHVMFSSWRRVDDNMIPARGKISGAYANSSFIKTEAIQAGFDEALVLTQEGHVSEGSAMNIFMVRDGVVATPPITENILEGITRKSVMKLLTDEIGIPVVERPIDRTEVYLCDEFFMTGTAAQVTAVTRVDHRPIGTRVMGPVAAQLRQIFSDICHGRHPKYHHWNTPVY